MTKEKEIIKKTKDYDKFQVFTFNRPINEGLVKSIMKSITKIGYIEAKPILVDKTFAIIDGQHRFNACKNLGIDVYYSVTSADPKEAIIELNAQQSRWALSNYIHMYAESGVKCYQHLIDFENRRRLGISNSIYVLFSGGGDLSESKKIKEGYKFSINTNAEKIAHFILSCEVPYNKSSHFVKAIVKLFKVGTEEHRAKVLAHIVSVSQQANMAGYLAAFENIVNRKVRNQNRVSFQSK